MALRLGLLSASHPSAEHCISNALTLTKFRVVGMFLDNFICFGGSQKTCAFSPAKKTTTPFFVYLHLFGRGKGQDRIAFLDRNTQST